MWSRYLSNHSAAIHLSSLLLSRSARRASHRLTFHESISVDYRCLCSIVATIEPAILYCSFKKTGVQTNRGKNSFDMFINPLEIGGGYLKSNNCWFCEWVFDDYRKRQRLVTGEMSTWWMEWRAVASIVVSWHDKIRTVW